MLASSALSVSSSFLQPCVGFWVRKTIPDFLADVFLWFVLHPAAFGGLEMITEVDLWSFVMTWDNLWHSWSQFLVLILKCVHKPMKPLCPFTKEVPNLGLLDLQETDRPVDRAARGQPEIRLLQRVLALQDHHSFDGLHLVIVLRANLFLNTPLRGGKGPIAC